MSKSAISTSSAAFLPLQPREKHLYLLSSTDFLPDQRNVWNVFVEVAFLYFSMLLNDLKHYLEAASLMNWLYPCLRHIHA